MPHFPDEQGGDGSFQDQAYEFRDWVEKVVRLMPFARLLQLAKVGY